MQNASARISQIMSQRKATYMYATESRMHKIHAIEPCGLSSYITTPLCAHPFFPFQAHSTMSTPTHVAIVIAQKVSE